MSEPIKLLTLAEYLKLLNVSNPSAEDVPFTPHSGMVATNVQTAIDEVHTAIGEMQTNIGVNDIVVVSALPADAASHPNRLYIVTGA